MSSADLVAGAHDVYERSGIGGRAGFGEVPAVVVVDFQNGFTEPSSPVGGDLTTQIEATAALLTAARTAGLPVAFTAVGFDPGLRDGGTWLRKMPGLGCLIDGTAACEIDPRVAPVATEPVWVKRASSAFFGTPLVPFLTAARVDTLIVVGCVTSGCIRATTVDAVSWGYRTIVPRECVGDRVAGPHDWNLFDIDSKYADVVALGEVLARLEAPAVDGTHATATTGQVA